MKRMPEKKKYMRLAIQAGERRGRKRQSMGPYRRYRRKQGALPQDRHGTVLCCRRRRHTLLDGEAHPIKKGSFAHIPPGVVHSSEGRMKVLVVGVPDIDDEDLYFPEEA